MREDQNGPEHRPMGNTAGIVKPSINSMALSSSLIIPLGGSRSL